MSLVSLAEAKQFLEINTNNFDSFITVVSNSVSAAVETYTNRKFSSANLTEYHNGGGDTVFVKVPPINNLYQVAEWNGTEYSNLVFNVALSADTEVGYDVDTGEISKRLFLKHHTFETPKFPNYRNAVKVFYNGGYDTVPEDIKLAALQWIRLIHKKLDGLQTFNYQNVGATLLPTPESGIPRHVKAILDLYRI